MLGWLRRRLQPAHRERGVPEERLRPRKRRLSSYPLLHQYLEDRYAQTVVLTFAEIEDLLGSALPEQARRQHEWWTRPAPGAPQPGYSDSWTLANRIARPNLPAQTVAFERAS